MTPCLSSGGGEVCLGDMVTGLQGLKNTWVKDRQGCLILGDLCGKKTSFLFTKRIICCHGNSRERGGSGWRGGCVVMGLALGEVPEQELGVAL